MQTSSFEIGQFKHKQWRIQKIRNGVPSTGARKRAAKFEATPTFLFV